ncbi:MAG: 50S ribosomal protein L10 [Candidatus Micrarchaeota archaeon]
MLSKQQKNKLVEDIKKDLSSFSTVAIVSNASLPASRYNAIRKKTVSQAKFDFARHSLLLKAINEGRPDAKELTKYLGNGSVLLLSNLDAFKLFKLFKQNRIKGSAKAGQIAPMDLIIPAGETNLPPGPVLTDLKNAKIKARIQGPKVVISEDALVAKKGDVITPVVANVLSKLGIQPMDVGLTVTAVFDKGVVYEGSVLNIDEEEFKSRLALGHVQALSLCVFAGILNAESIIAVIQKASREANAINALVESKGSA